eukprot:3987378-Alexandrium_andersonii.AAC.1
MSRAERGKQRVARKLPLFVAPTVGTRITAEGGRLRQFNQGAPGGGLQEEIICFGCFLQFPARVPGLSLIHI